jgi:hypothetical protein
MTLFPREGHGIQASANKQIQKVRNMKNGHHQKLMRVDLTARKGKVESIPEEDLKKFIGGAGLGVEILRREVPGKLPPSVPRNKVIFGTGPFQGPPIAGGAKLSIVGISPVGTCADTAGGADWGPALKDAGEKGWPSNKARKPALGKEGPPPFLARRMFFWPGTGPLCHGEFFLFAEPIEDRVFHKKAVFFSTEKERIISSFPAT